MRVDEAAGIAYVAVDGEPEIAYDEVAYAGSDYVELVNAASQWVYASYYGSEPVYIEFGQDGTFDFSEGYFGVETAPSALPTETASYYGGWSAEGQTDTTSVYAGGNLTVAIGFASGEIVGFTQGGYDAFDDTTESYEGGSLAGIVSGSVDGSRIVGTMDFFGETTGQMDLAGAIYGETGEYAAGGVGGSLDTDLGTQSLGGEFFLYQSGDERFGPCGLC